MLVMYTYYAPSRTGGIKRSVRLSVSADRQYARWLRGARWLPAAGRPPEMCGLRTRPRTDVDPLRVELPSAGAYRLAAPGAITCFLLFI